MFLVTRLNSLDQQNVLYWKSSGVMQLANMFNHLISVLQSGKFKLFLKRCLFLLNLKLGEYSDGDIKVPVKIRHRCKIFIYSSSVAAFGYWCLSAGTGNDFNLCVVLCTKLMGMSSLGFGLLFL